MDYWHDFVTEKSWRILQEINSDFRFILIGGWAVYLWARTLKSKDINIIVDIKTLSGLKSRYDLRKNDNLRKYEIRKEEIDIDIYVPYYSRLIIPPEGIESESIEGFKVARPEHLLILKQGSERERRESEKGEKDRIDILSMLFNCSIDFGLYYRLLKKHRLEYLLKELIRIVRQFNNYKYMGMTPRKLKLKKQAALERLRKI